MSWRLTALEEGSVEAASSVVTFSAEEASTTPLGIATLVERVQILESKVNSLEPSISSL